VLTLQSSWSGPNPRRPGTSECCQVGPADAAGPHGVGGHCGRAGTARTAARANKGHRGIPPRPRACTRAGEGCIAAGHSAETGPWRPPATAKTADAGTVEFPAPRTQPRSCCRSWSNTIACGVPAPGHGGLHGVDIGKRHTSHIAAAGTRAGKSPGGRRGPAGHAIAARLTPEKRTPERGLVGRPPPPRHQHLALPSGPVPWCPPTNTFGALRRSSLLSSTLDDRQGLNRLGTRPRAPSPCPPAFPALNRARPATVPSMGGTPARARSWLDPAPRPRPRVPSAWRDDTTPWRDTNDGPSVLRGRRAALPGRTCPGRATAVFEAYEAHEQRGGPAGTFLVHLG